MPKEIPIDLKAQALEMLKTTDLNTVSRVLHIYRRTLRLWANENDIQISDPPRHEYYYTTEFKKEVVDYCLEHGIDATLEQYPMSRASLNQWIKDAQPTITTPAVCDVVDTLPAKAVLKGIIVYDIKLDSGISFQVNVNGPDINKFEDWIKNASGIQEYNILKAVNTIRPSTRKRTKIADARIAAGLTQRELAEMLGVRTSQEQRWESGKNEPKIATLMRMSEILGVPLENLVEEEHSSSECPG